MCSSFGGAFSMQHKGAVQRTGIEVAACYEQNAEQLIMPYWSPQPCSSKRTVVLGAFSRCSWVLTFSGWKWQWASPHFFCSCNVSTQNAARVVEGFLYNHNQPVINHFWRWWTASIPFLDGPLHRETQTGVVCVACVSSSLLASCAFHVAVFCNVSLRR